MIEVSHVVKKYDNRNVVNDVSFEVNNITYYEKEFEEKKLIYKESLNKEGKMYLKLIITIGLAVCIILI